MKEPNTLSEYLDLTKEIMETYGDASKVPIAVFRELFGYGEKMMKQLGPDHEAYPKLGLTNFKLLDIIIGKGSDESK